MPQSELPDHVAASRVRPSTGPWEAGKGRPPLRLGSIRARSLEPLQLSQGPQKLIALLVGALPARQSAGIWPGAQPTSLSWARRAEGPRQQTFLRTTLGAPKPWAVTGPFSGPAATALPSGHQAAERLRFVPSLKLYVDRRASWTPRSRIVSSV